MTFNEIEVLVQNTFDGIAVDGSPWRGGPVRLSVDFTGGESLKVKRKDTDKMTRFDTSLAFGANGRSGIYISNAFILVQRALKAFPEIKQELMEEFVRRASKKLISKDIESAFAKMPRRMFNAAVGRRESDNWKDVATLSVRNIRLGRKPSFARGGLYLPFQVDASFFAFPHEDPALALTEREIREYMEIEQEENPESFWADGEHGSLAEAQRSMRNWIDNMSPRDQDNLRKQMHRRGSAKVPKGAEKVKGTEYWVSNESGTSPFRGQKNQFKIYNENGGVMGGAPNKSDAVAKARGMDKSARTLRDRDGRNWGPKHGLEGPILFRGGIVLYYDPRENGGTYYNPANDMYLSDREADRLSRNASGKISQRVASRHLSKED